MTAATPALTFTTPTSASVTVGGSLTNAATSTLSGGSYGAITYASSSTAAANVNSTTGVITPVAAGTTTITATQAAVSGVNAQATQTYTLTVNAALPAGYVVSGGLTWAPITRNVTWDYAQSTCDNLSVPGITGKWRLPNLGELSALFTAKGWPSTGWIRDITWSSDAYGTLEHRTVDLGGGSVGHYDNYGYQLAMSCVH